MGIMLKSFRLTFLILTAMLLIIVSGFAVNIGVSPGIVNFKNMLRGGYAERTIAITVGSDDPVITEVSVRGDIKDWVNFSATTFEVSKADPYRLKIVIRPPTDVQNGDYTGYIRILTAGLGSIGEGESGSVVRAAVDVITTVTIVDTEVKACRAKGFSVRSVEKGDPIEFTLNAINDGNIKINPLVTIDIWDQERENIVEFVEFDNEEVLPTVSKDIKIIVPSDSFEIGQYWADIRVEECSGVSDTLTFDVMEKGSLRADGVLKQITNKVWSTVGETIPIQVVFQNTGEKQVSAKFKGNIRLGEKVVKVLESEELEVPVAETISFTLFFTPEEIGRYVVSGRVFYDKKRTYESSSVINVMPPEKKPVNFKIVAYSFMLFVVLFLVWKIKRGKKKRLAPKN